MNKNFPSENHLEFEPFEGSDSDYLDFDHPFEFYLDIWQKNTRQGMVTKDESNVEKKDLEVPCETLSSEMEEFLSISVHDLILELRRRYDASNLPDEEEPASRTLIKSQAIDT